MDQVLYNFEGQTEDELTLKKGDLVSVKSEIEGWYLFFSLFSFFLFNLLKGLKNKGTSEIMIKDKWDFFLQLMYLLSK